LIGNGDAHLKNFSLLESRDGDMVLTPTCDLLSTSVHFSRKEPNSGIWPSLLIV
jgi:serine/threonine-protein kinase HipA